MQIIPAIDILDGQVVRLLKGDYNKSVTYSKEPLDIANHFKNHQIECIHVVDLDGAKCGSPVNQKTILSLVQEGIQFHVGGGIRTLQHAESYLEAGIKRIILSTSVLKTPSFWKELISRFGEDRLILSLDIKSKYISMNGWLEDTKITIKQALERLQNVKHVIVTDIERDGTLIGPNFNLYQSLKEQHPHLNLIAAGGITTIDEVKQLNEIGVSKAIIGKAIYENERLANDIQRFHFFQKYATLCDKINWEKVKGLVPAIIQSDEDLKVLMLGFMNPEALMQTIGCGLVTFFSRTRQKLWLKGRTSGKLLVIKSIALDCDQDTLLIKVVPKGPTCHRNTHTCFDDIDGRAKKT